MRRTCTAMLVFLTVLGPVTSAHAADAVPTEGESLKRVEAEPPPGSPKQESSSAANSPTGTTFTPARDAREDPTASGKGSVSLLLGYGFNQAYEAGVGVRAGYTLPMKLYIGAAFTYHFGSTQENECCSSRDYSLIYGGEIGYALAANEMAIRPYVGIGGFTEISAVGAPLNSTSSKSYLTFWPGVAILVPITPAFFGVDFRYNAVVGGNLPTDAFSVWLTGGGNF
jgi:hypothetical protein